jgi:hypothetical protein
MSTMTLRRRPGWHGAPHESRGLRRHRQLMLALAVLLSCAGACDWEAPRATTLRTNEDGRRAERLRVKTWETRARFECLQSTPGPCHVTVYSSDCNLDGPADLRPPCRARTLRRFTLAVGEARDSANLPRGFRWCLRHGARGEPFCRRT